MKTLTKISILGLLALLLMAPVSVALAQQNTIVQTSLSAAITATQTTFAVASATGINAPVSNTAPGSELYVVDIGQTMGEAMRVVGVSGTQITVRRDGPGKGTPHISGAAVFVATVPSWFTSTDPAGGCTTAQTFAVPLINIQNGRQWFCSSSTLTWVPGWGNYSAGAQVITATATASASGATAIVAPLVHINGTNAITSFTMSTGWNGQGFCVIPDAAFTTTASNNIGKASTAVAAKALCYVYDKVAAAFMPSY